MVQLIVLIRRNPVARRVLHDIKSDKNTRRWIPVYSRLRNTFRQKSDLPPRVNRTYMDFGNGATYG